MRLKAGHQRRSHVTASRTTVSASPTPRRQPAVSRASGAPSRTVSWRYTLENLFDSNRVGYDQAVGLVGVGAPGDRHTILARAAETGVKCPSGCADPQQAIKWMIQTAEGLEFAHRKGIIHRDIKSSNLLLDQDENVRILDLGLAKVVDMHLGHRPREVGGERAGDPKRRVV